MRASTAPAAVLLVLVGLVGCSAPSGAERPGCDAEWLELEAAIAHGAGGAERAVPMECVSSIGPRRVRVGFVVPPGPDCLELSRIELVESADAASITLFLARNDDPNAGSCPPERRLAVTELDLQAPIDDRVLLDGADADG